jgi:hypothetical protein
MPSRATHLVAATTPSRARRDSVADRPRFGGKHCANGVRTTRRWVPSPSWKGGAAEIGCRLSEEACYPEGYIRKRQWFQALRVLGVRRPRPDPVIAAGAVGGRAGHLAYSFGRISGLGKALRGVVTDLAGGLDEPSGCAGRRSDPFRENAGERVRLRGCESFARHRRIGRQRHPYRVPSSRRV